MHRGKRTIAAGVIVALVALLPGLAHAQTRSSDYNLGYWAVTCRLQWQGSDETITLGSDGGWARTACDGIAGNTSPDNQYVYYPLTQPRPGTVQCAYIYTYGGYWLTERPPYQGYTGSAQIAVRDDDGSPVGQAACSSVGGQADAFNSNHGFNIADNPLAPIQECTQCGGGGGGGGAPVTGSLTTSLPGAPKAKHPHKKPPVYVNGKRKK
jgi:hypothetical protein